MLRRRVALYAKELQELDPCRVAALFHLIVESYLLYKILVIRYKHRLFPKARCLLSYP